MKYNETNTLIYFSPSLRDLRLLFRDEAASLGVESVVLCRSFFKICVNMIASSGKFRMELEF